MRPQARQWSRSAWALAILFASLPVAGRLFLGMWVFQGAAALAFLCFLIGTYLHFLGRRPAPALPDPAAMLDEAIELFESGQIRRAMRLLNRAIRQSPRFWQARELRGKLNLATGNSTAAAADFAAAVALAPGESQLRALLKQAREGRVNGN